MRKIITFLGRFPKETSYRFGDQVFRGQVFAEALAQFVEFDQMVVCVTEEARLDAWPVLARMGDERIVSTSIPRGETTEEMWSIFDAILEHIQDGDTVLFDITHGLRSLPFLTFIFAAYLRAARQVKIEAIYYGALELGNPKENVPAPVIDLSEFVTMLDWLTATDQFVETGNARRLAELIGPLQKRGSTAAFASANLLNVSQAALFCMPFTLQKTAAGLSQRLQDAQGTLKQTARPFEILRQRIDQTFSQFGAQRKDTRAMLLSEFRLILWYYQNNQLIQALSLGREWLIDAVTYRLGEPLDYKHTSRTTMERAISGLARVGRKEVNPQTNEQYVFRREDLNQFGRTIYDSWPEHQQLKETWEMLSAVRNTLDHAEHQASPLSMEKVFKKAWDVQELLMALAQVWGLA